MATISLHYLASGRKSCMAMWSTSWELNLFLITVIHFCCLIGVFGIVKTSPNFRAWFCTQIFILPKILRIWLTIRFNFSSRIWLKVMLKTSNNYISWLRCNWMILSLWFWSSEEFRFAGCYRVLTNYFALVGGIVVGKNVWWIDNVILSKYFALDCLVHFVHWFDVSDDL